MEDLEAIFNNNNNEKELKWMEVTVNDKTYTIFSNGNVYEEGDELYNFVLEDCKEVEELIRTIVNFLKIAIKHYDLEDKFKNILGDGNG